MKIHGWGKYPYQEACIHHASNHSELRKVIQQGNCIARGLGRSYGDSALSANVISTQQLRYFLDFNPKTGLLICESGVSLADIIDAFLPRGFFLAVTPGTKFVTIGGAIASDVHGKNHHHVGCFSEFVENIELLLPNGEIVNCNRQQNQELFHATCGGMGLTGIILAATIKLIPITSSTIQQRTIKSANLNATLAAFHEHKEATYSVAWLDCTAKGKHLGRSLLMLGEHADDNNLVRSTPRNLNVPFNMPSIMLNRYSIRAFNHFYYQRIKQDEVHDRVNLDKFFYPLDSISQWNNLYGRKGFTQYQFVIPLEDAEMALQKILGKIADYGNGSFLSVLKLFGKANSNYLSFPQEGFTFALDFKMEPTLFHFLEQLDRLVQDYNGRVYLAKDVRMPADFFHATYNKVEQFQKIRASIGATDKLSSLQSTRLGI